MTSPHSAPSHMDLFLLIVKELKLRLGLRLRLEEYLLSAAVVVEARLRRTLQTNPSSS